MVLDDYYIDELLYIRDNERKAKNWSLCDEIRIYLDAKSVFVFDTKQGQEVYFEAEGVTRACLIDKIRRGNKALKIFNAWLYTTRLKSRLINNN